MNILYITNIFWIFFVLRVIHRECGIAAVMKDNFLEPSEIACNSKSIKFVSLNILLCILKICINIPYNFKTIDRVFSS